MYLLCCKSNRIVLVQRRIDVIIPFRNEREHLISWVDFLANWESSKFQFFFVDDHSNDGGVELLESIRSPFVQCIVLTDNFKGKKAAIFAGIQASSSDLILTLDADVLVSSEYFEAVSLVLEEPYDLTILPVDLVCDSTLVGWYQYAEWQFLQALTCLSFKMCIPMLCNGANLLFSRKLYQASHNIHAHISSGDDMFMLMHAVRNNSRINLKWGKKFEVQTMAKSTWYEALNQRLRWAGKSGQLPRSKSDLGYVGFALWQILKLSSILTAFWNVNYLCLASSLALIETAAVYLIQSSSFKFSRLFGQFILAMTYPFISLGIFITSYFVKPEWKGREVSL